MYFCYIIAFSIDVKNLEIFSFALVTNEKKCKVLSKAVVFNWQKKTKVELLSGFIAQKEFHLVL